MSKSIIKVAPSILSGDFGCLAKEAKRLEENGADLIHIDVMDGHFVPNITFGPIIIEAINRATDVFLDVHLMMYNPFDYIEKFVTAGADRITFHFEATEHIEDTIAFIKKCNCQVGLAFKPDTSIEFIPKYLHLCDLILIMTVQPGFGGQLFISSTLDKVEFVKKCAKDLKQLEIQVDGGINRDTAEDCVKKGANVLVSGSYLFKQKNMASAIKELQQLKSKL